VHAFVVAEQIVEAIVFVSNNDERNRCANYSRYQDHRSCFHRLLFLALVGGLVILAGLSTL
jgi:hypothetical protein